MLLRGEFAGFRLNTIDRAMIVWSFVGMIVYTLRIGTAEALIYQAGMTFDLLGMYFFLRLSIRDWGDVIRLADAIAILAMASVVFFAVEFATQRNLFAIFGGVNEVTMIREGKLRCQGPFDHPIHAGTFWGVLLPVVASWRKSSGASRSRWRAPIHPRHRLLQRLQYSHSHRRLRHRRFPRDAVTRPDAGDAVGRRGSLLFLHVVREKPVWHLISRIDILGGSTGYHRYRLIDAAIERWQEWFLMGTNSTAHWGYFLFDVTNQYINEGVRGGMLTMILFMIVLGVTFKYVGRVWRMQRHNKQAVRIAWGLGTSLFAECVMFIAVSITYSSELARRCSCRCHRLPLRAGDEAPALGDGRAARDASNGAIVRRVYAPGCGRAGVAGLRPQSMSLGTKEPRVLAVCSAGGHWVQLSRLLPALEGCDLAIATVDTEPARATAAVGAITSQMRRWDRIALVRLALRMLWIMRGETGLRAVGWAPRLLIAIRQAGRARTLWIDSIANVERCRWPACACGATRDLWLTQWSTSPAATRAASGRSMIFVTVGSQMPFDRLVMTVDSWAQTAVAGRVRPDQHVTMSRKAFLLGRRSTQASTRGSWKKRRSSSATPGWGRSSPRSSAASRCW